MIENQLTFNTANEIQLISVIREIYDSGYSIVEYTVDKVNNTTTFKLEKGPIYKLKDNLTNTNEKTKNRVSRIKG